MCEKCGFDGEGVVYKIFAKKTEKGKEGEYDLQVGIHIETEELEKYSQDEWEVIDGVASEFFIKRIVALELVKMSEELNTEGGLMRLGEIIQRARDSKSN